MLRGTDAATCGVVVALFGLGTGRVRLALGIAGLLLLGNAGLSLYHVGVEQGWFALPGGCIAGRTATTIEELRAQLAVAPPTCDQVSVSWLGLSLAGWNGLFALALGVIAITAAAWGSPLVKPSGEAAAR